MANKRIQQYPEKTSPSSSDYLLLADNQDVDVNGFLKYKKIKISSLDNIVITNAEDILLADLLTAISTNDLVIGRFYRITNSSVGEPIIVQAVALNMLSEIGISGDDGKVYKYNVNTDTISSFPSLNDFVPYTGATNDVDLGEFGVDAGFVTYDTTPTNTPTSQATTYWDSTEETLALIMNGVTQRVGLDTYFNAKNQTGTNIPKGTAVRFAGTDGNSGNLLIAPMLADGTYPSVYYMGITAEAIGNGQFGKVMSLGKLRTNTNAYVDGDILYVSSTVAGGFQTTAPLAPNNIIIAASVVNAANNGVLEVRATLGSNINNDEGVKITSPTTGQLLQLQSNGLWENKTKAQVLGGTSSQFVKGDGSLLNDGTANQLLGMNVGATAQEYKTLNGTTSQVVVTNASGSITLSLPQSIATTSSPTFAGATLTGNTTINGASGLVRFNINSTGVDERIIKFQTSGLGRWDILVTNEAETGSDAGSNLRIVSRSDAGGGLRNNVTINRATGDITLSNPLGRASGGTGISTAPTNGQLLIGNGTAYTLAGITGTANQVTVTNGAGSITLSLPQSIATTSTPQFSKLGLGSAVNSNFILRVSSQMTGATTIYGAYVGSQIQTDVTSTAYGYGTDISLAASVNLSNLIHFVASQSAFGGGATNTTQSGFLASSTLISATNNYGFRGQIPSGSGRWNIYMDGTASNYFAGAVGIGSTSLTEYNLRVNRSLTGGATAIGIMSQGQIQSDVTSTASYHDTFATTQATAFTLTNLIHYRTDQGTIGATSTVTNQYGFFANNSLTGATNNFGFRADIASGSGRWNFYANGTASNYFAGKVQIGSTTDGGELLQVTGTARITGATAIGGTAVASALLTLTSTTQGLLLPRMTTAQRNAIATPAAGLMIYNTTTNKLNVYTTAWEQVTSA